jgi:asparagine synthase (glutamine-hydrolysing)
LHGDDRAALAFGVEQRVPLVDYRLVEFGLSLPLEHKIRGGEQRFFIRQAFRKKLPKLVNRAPKRPVPSPQREWFKKELRSWIRPILASKSFGRRPYFNQKKVLQEYDRYCRADFNPNSFHIWQWVHLEIWLRTFID